MNDHQSADTVSPAAGPEAMRQAMRQFVAGLHQAYLDIADQQTPGDRARMPLLDGGHVTVLAVGARNLHVLATTQALPAPKGQEVALDDAIDDLRWTLRFYDPVIVPLLGMIDESAAPKPAEVRRVLGIESVAYHITVEPGGGLSGHHAGHAGTGLAYNHVQRARDIDAMRAKLPRSGHLLDEYKVAVNAHLPIAAGLLAREIAPTDTQVAELVRTGAGIDDIHAALVRLTR